MISSVWLTVDLTVSKKLMKGEKFSRGEASLCYNMSP